MTPTELDAIFRAWRDDWFAAYPSRKEYRDHYAELASAIWLHGRVKNSWPLTHDVIARALETEQAFRAANDELTIFVPRSPQEPFVFTDPPPLPASAPIPFTAGKALLEEVERISYPYSDGSIVMRFVCARHFPQWFDACPTCKATTP